MKLFSNDLGVDLGTCNVRIFAGNKGVVVNEPSVVAVDKNTGRILQVGTEARNMLGRTPGNIVAMHPLKDGVVSDHIMTVRLLQELLRDAAPKGLFTPKPRVVLAVPSGATNVEERTLINAAIEAGARSVYMIESPLAAALGANLNISGPNGHMVVEIGGGTTNIAVLSLNGVAISSSCEVAGDSFDEAIVRYMRRRHGVVIGKSTAEDIKIKIGCVDEPAEDVPMTVRGRDAKSGMPCDLTITSQEIFEVLRRLARTIADEVVSVLEDTSPELVSDISENGITLTGGGCQIWGMTSVIEARTGIRCTVADDPASCVAYGCGKILPFISHMKEGPINIDKKRIMRQ